MYLHVALIDRHSGYIYAPVSIGPSDFAAYSEVPDGLRDSHWHELIFVSGLSGLDRIKPASLMQIWRSFGLKKRTVLNIMALSSLLPRAVSSSPNLKTSPPSQLRTSAFSALFQPIDVSHPCLPQCPTRPKLSTSYPSPHRRHPTFS